MSETNDIYILLDRPRKLAFRHKDVQAACMAYSHAVGMPKQQLLDVLSDEFIGWALLLYHGLRFNNRDISNPAMVSDLVQAYVQRRKAEGVKLAHKEIGDKLREACVDAGWLTIDVAEPEGNEQAPELNPGM